MQTTTLRLLAMSSAMRTVAELRARDSPSREGYIVLNGERIFVRVVDAQVVMAEASPLAGYPNYNRKWRAEEGRGQVHAGAAFGGHDHAAQDRAGSATNRDMSTGDQG